MSAYLQLTLAQLKLFLRNRQMLFWTLFFPIFFMVMLGSFFGKGNSMSISALVLDHDQTVESQALIETFKKQPTMTVETAIDEAEALKQLKRGDQQLVIVIPQGYGNMLESRGGTAGAGGSAAGAAGAKGAAGASAAGAAPAGTVPAGTPSASAAGAAAAAPSTGGAASSSSDAGAAAGAPSAGAQAAASPSQPVQIKAYYDETNLTVSQVALTIVGQVVDGVSKAVTHYTPVVTVQQEGVQSLNLKYIDFLVPGIVAMMIMSNNLNGVAAQIASWRERGVLRRMQSTTLKASTFIAAQITARLILNGLQAVIVLVVGSLFFSTQVNGSWLLLLMFIVLGTLAFMAIGFIIAGLAKTPESAGPIAGFISFPMLFLGGVFFPIKDMPEFLQPLVKLLPISHLTTALRQVMNVGAGIGEMWPEAAILGGWLIAAFIVSTFTFKWE